MTRLAIMSDPHGNFEALTQVFKDIDSQGVDEVFCLGDIVGYGPQPQECCDLMRERKVMVITGNHEQGLINIHYLGGFNQPATPPPPNPRPLPPAPPHASPPSHPPPVLPHRSPLPPPPPPPPPTPPIRPPAPTPGALFPPPPPHSLIPPTPAVATIRGDWAHRAPSRLAPGPGPADPAGPDLHRRRAGTPSDDS